MTNVEDGVSAEGPDAAYALPDVRIQTVSPTTVTAGQTLTITVSGVSGLGGRVRIGSRTIIPTQTQFVNGVGTYTVTVPSNLDFDTDPCPGGGGATAPQPTDFDITFEDTNGCDDNLSGVLTVNPPNTGKLFLNPDALTMTATVGSPTQATFRIINTGAGSLTVNSIGSAGAPFSVSAPATPLTLLSCESASVTVTYNPAAAGTNSTNVAVNTNGGNASVAVSGVATAPAPTP